MGNYRSASRGVSAPTARAPDPAYTLLLLNILLQIFDGVATYHGTHRGVHELNALLRAAFEFWGVGVSLLLFKSFACAALGFIYAVCAREVARTALALTAGVYCLLSLMPWLTAFLVFLREV